MLRTGFGNVFRLKEFTPPCRNAGSILFIAVKQGEKPLCSFTVEAFQHVVLFEGQVVILQGQEGQCQIKAGLDMAGVDPDHLPVGLKRGQ